MKSLRLIIGFTSLWHTLFLALPVLPGVYCYSHTVHNLVLWIKWERNGPQGILHSWGRQTLTVFHNTLHIHTQEKSQAARALLVSHWAVPYWGKCDTGKAKLTVFPTIFKTFNLRFFATEVCWKFSSELLQFSKAVLSMSDFSRSMCFYPDAKGSWSQFTGYFRVCSWEWGLHAYY